MEKNNNKNEKKKFSAEPFLGYCPNYIVNFFFFVLQAL